jgi:hypothetical protein
VRPLHAPPRARSQDYYRIETANAPAPPDGKRVAFVRTYLVESENRRQSETWLAPSTLRRRCITNPSFNATDRRSDAHCSPSPRDVDPRGDADSVEEARLVWWMKSPPGISDRGRRGRRSSVPTSLIAFTPRVYSRAWLAINGKTQRALQGQDL